MVYPVKMVTARARMSTSAETNATCSRFRFLAMPLIARIGVSHLVVAAAHPEIRYLELPGVDHMALIDPNADAWREVVLPEIAGR
ncbi:MAG: hypothetical protein BGO26_00855 [Actinobacteria bacterium 69-20]|jgi:hypothetical protein|nr:MAG: hypothetical protein BGO26_00855 [Actinobacteria bacterium 69-20]